MSQSNKHLKSSDFKKSSLRHNWRTWLVIVGSSTIIMAFQNCSSVFLSKSEIETKPPAPMFQADQDAPSTPAEDDSNK